MDSYLPILAMLILGVLFAGLSFVASALLSTRRPTLAKSAPYECGIVPSREPAERFPVRFYLIAMIFIIFDIEIVFLYPWAVIYGRLALFGFVEMIVFAVAVFVSFLYLLSNGALDWGPAKSMRAVTPGAAAEGRTSRTTVRRVSRDQTGTESVPREPEVIPAA